MADLDDKYTVRSCYENVVLTNAKFRCTKCRKWKPASDFGLRCMSDDIVRNQSQCKGCRSNARKLRVVK